MAGLTGARDDSGARGDLLRVTVAGDPPLVVDLPAEEGVGVAAGDLVQPLPSPPGEPTVRRLEVVVDGWRFETTVESGRRARLRERTQRRPAGVAEGRHVVRAPLPGRIVHVWVTPGQTVGPGGRLCSLEAMKMENEVISRRAGTIERVSVQEGARVELGDELLVIA